MDRAEDFARDIAGGVTGKILHLLVDSWIDAPTRQDYEASYYGYRGFLQRGLATIMKALAIADEPENRVRIVRSPADLDAAARDRQLALELGTEGGKLIEEDLANLEAFWRLGLRHIQLNWAMRNQIGASQSNEDEPDQPGLTPFGFQVVERMNSLCILI